VSTEVFAFASGLLTGLVGGVTFAMVFGWGDQ